MIGFGFARGLVLGLLTVVCSTQASGQTFTCSGAVESPYPAFVPTNHDHTRWAPQARGPAKTFTAFHAVFDDADDDDQDGQADLRLNPEFVIYEIRGLAPNNAGDYPEPRVSIRRPGKWYTSPELVPIAEQVPNVTNRRLDDSYSGIGTIWNRGHLAMSDHAQRINAEAACNTHHFWNASPQANDLNQGPWQHLENYTAAAANKYRNVWVVAGPIFNRNSPKLTIGDPGELPVEIPDAFFKVIVHESPFGIATLAFIFEQPNSPNTQGQPVPTASWIPCNRARSVGHVYDHRPQLSSISAIEQRTGLRFFTQHPNRAALVASRATALWPVERRYWDPSSAVCARQRSHP